MERLVFLTCLCLLIGFFSTSEKSSAYFEEQSSAYFEDQTKRANIFFQHFSGASAQKYPTETMGSGVGLLDYDGDGFLDIFLVNGSGNPALKPDRSTSHVLYRNLGNGQYADITEQAGVGGYGNYGNGVAVGDVNNDGWPDLYVTHYGPNVLYLNRGNGTFLDVSEKAGVDDRSWGASAAFFDFDNDAHLDLYVTNYLDFHYDQNPFCASKEGGRSYCDPDVFSGVADKLYRNRGDGTFEDMTPKSGISNPEGKGLGVVTADADNDGWMDIYVANDKVRNFLYKNNGGSTFSDVTFLSLTGYNEAGLAEAGMGTDFADFDGDGLLDIFVTNLDMETNGLYRNNGDLIFSDERWIRGVARPSIRLVGFGTMFFDFDNDGDQDLFVANGHVLDDAPSHRDNVSYRQPNQLLENRGGIFHDVSPFAGKPFSVTNVSRGAAFGDVDNDGDVDIVVSNSNDSPNLLINQGGNKKNWILLQLVGLESNRDAVGAKIRLATEGGVQYDQRTGGGSYLSAHDPRMHFGLGTAQIVHFIEVRWPSGIMDCFEEVNVNQILVIEEGSTKHQDGACPNSQSKY